MGGRVAIEVGLRAPERVAGLALLAPGGGLRQARLAPDRAPAAPRARAAAPQPRPRPGRAPVLEPVRRPRPGRPQRGRRRRRRVPAHLRERRARGWPSSPRRATSTSSAPSGAAASTRGWPSSRRPRCSCGARATGSSRRASSATWPSGCPTPSRSCSRTAATSRRSSAPSRRSACCGASSARRRARAAPGTGARGLAGRLSLPRVRPALLASPPPRAARRRSRRVGRGPRLARRRAPARDADRPRHRPRCRRRCRSTGAASPPRATPAPASACAAASPQGRHRLRACRGRACSTSAPFVVTSGPILGGCPVLPPDSPWNTDVSAAPPAPDSAALVGAQAAGHDVHLDFGDTQSEYGIPYALGRPTQRRVPIAFGTDGADYGDESDHGPFPIPAARADRGRTGRAARPAGGRPPRHRRPARALRATTSSTTPCASTAARRGRSPRPRAGTSPATARRPAGWTSADAAGLPILPGLLRYDEAASGTIRHALRFTLPRARRAWQAPAGHCGTTTDASAPPYGSRWRLKASFDEIALPRPGAGHRPRAQALRADVRRPGLGDVHHRHDRPALDADDRGHQPAPPDPRRRLRGRRRAGADAVLTRL